MTLDEFIKETLVAIQKGVGDAINIQSSGSGSVLKSGAINPIFEEWQGDFASRVSPVEFDVAVTVENSSESGERARVGGGIRVLEMVTFGARTEDEQSSRLANATVSRVQFSVEILPPMQKVEARKGHELRSSATPQTGTIA